MIISIIVAASENNVIGKNNQLPWHLPTDLKYFKNITWAMPIVMGRKTYESIGKPLPGRQNIVITRNRQFAADGVTVVASVKEAIDVAAQNDVKELFIIGGAEVFNTTLEDCQRVYLTRVHATLEGDTFFPELDKKQWEKIKDTSIPADEKNQYPLSFQVWEKISTP